MKRLRNSSIHLLVVTIIVTREIVIVLNYINLSQFFPWYKPSSRYQADYTVDYINSID